ncbi:MAG TPA: hypothetical protein VM532_04920 [Burkholderiales bacterium]|jgi:hypothetical protein|nr:hypothetical protein [Burkholderiales bacterium]
MKVVLFFIALAIILSAFALTPNKWRTQFTHSAKRLWAPIIAAAIITGAFLYFAFHFQGKII